MSTVMAPRRLARITDGAANPRRLTRTSFIAKLRAISGDTRLLWVARAGDTTASVSSDPLAKVITWDADASGRLAVLGGHGGRSLAFVAASSQYGTTPDVESLSFGNGTQDVPFSILVLANVTDTAAIRTLLSKWNAAGSLEYLFRLTATDTLTLLLRDDSAAVTASRTSDAAVTQGAWKLFGVTYDGGGGATAANGITLYEDGVVVASTATNNASYVAMENLGALVEIGTATAHTANFMEGSQALSLLCGGALTAAQQLQILALCRAFYGVPA